MVIVAPDHTQWHIYIYIRSIALLWMKDRSVAETPTWQHTTLTKDRHSCPRRYSNPQSQQASCRTHTRLRPRGHRDGLFSFRCHNFDLIHFECGPILAPVNQVISCPRLYKLQFFYFWTRQRLYTWSVGDVADSDT